MDAGPRSQIEVFLYMKSAADSTSKHISCAVFCNVHMITLYKISDAIQNLSDFDSRRL